MADVSQLIGEARKQAVSRKVLSDSDNAFLIEFGGAVEILANYRNKIFHGEWQDLIRGDGEPNSVDYYWVPIVRNYLFVSFALVQATILLERVRTPAKGNS